jgi:hypothetical protein
VNTSSQPSAEDRPGVGRSLWFVAMPLFALLVAVLILAMSGGITGREGTYPRALAVVVAVLALVSIRSDYLTARRETAGQAAPALSAGEALDEHADPLHEEGGEDFENGRGAGVAGKRVVALGALTGLSIYLMTWLGFFIPSALLIGGALLILGVRTWWKVAAYTVGLVVTAHLLFVEALGVPFPPAPWS